MELQIEINKNVVKDGNNFSAGNGNLVMVTPAIDESYWLLRVPVSDKQAVVCFPKFFTIGCGFQHEEDWNTNLPIGCPTDEIFNHIKCNKGDKRISNDDCRKAIDMLREKAIELKLIKKEAL
jgi:hypothetical protein